MTADAEWTRKAACRDQPSSIFFPECGINPDAALAVCAGCEVRQECLDFAVTTNQTDGVWGGLTAKQRRRQKTYRIVYCNYCARRFSWMPGEKFSRPPIFCSAVCRRASRAKSHAATHLKRKLESA